MAPENDGMGMDDEDEDDDMMDNFWFQQNNNRIKLSLNL